MISIANKILIPSKKLYEGTMTVGFGDLSDGTGTHYYYGYELNWIGEMNPPNPQVPGFKETVAIGFYYYEDNTQQTYTQLYVIAFDGGPLQACNTLEIDGEIYTGFDQYGNITNVYQSSPFPNPGNTCVIKLY